MIEIAMMSPVFAVTEPTALPMARALVPRAAPMHETISSGRVVAKLTIVAPTMKRGIPETSAIQPAASTKKSPPLTISARPTIKRAISPHTGQPATENISENLQRKIR